MPQSLSDDKSALVQAPSGTKPLPEPVLNKISNVIWRHKAPMNEIINIDNICSKYHSKSLLVIYQGGRVKMAAISADDILKSF